jgi:hypothetical protein
VRCNLGLTSEFAEPRSPAVVVDWQLAVARVNHQSLSHFVPSVALPPRMMDVNVGAASVITQWGQELV